MIEITTTKNVKELCRINKVQHQNMIMDPFLIQSIPIKTHSDICSFSTETVSFIYFIKYNSVPEKHIFKMPCVFEVIYYFESIEENQCSFS